MFLKFKPKQNHIMEQYLLPLIFILAGIIYGLGIWLHDRPMMFFAGFLLVLLGIYLPINGFYGLENEFLLLSVTIIICGLGVYILGYNSYQWIMEGWGSESSGSEN